MTTTTPALDAGLVERVAAAAAASLPLPARVTPADPVPVDAAPLPDAPAAVTLRVAGQSTGLVAVIVGGDVVASLESTPIGELDLAGALQPALAAAASAAGPGGTGAAERVDAEELITRLTGDDRSMAVPLVAGGTVHAVIIVSLSGPAVANAPSTRPAVSGDALHLLADVEMAVTVEIGRTRLAVRDLLSLAPGAVVELDRAAGSPADLLVNGRMIARGEVVVVDEDYALRITEIVNGDQTS